jgi:hypothetical protein
MVQLHKSIKNATHTYKFCSEVGIHQVPLFLTLHAQKWKAKNGRRFRHTLDLALLYIPVR